MNDAAVSRNAMARVIIRGRHHLPLAEAFKAGLVCAAPAVLAAAMHAPLLCWSAIATFWTCLADDASASPRSRLLNGVLFGVLGALASGLAIAVAPLAWVAIALIGIVVYTAGLARLPGAAPGLRGLLLATACAVSASFPAHAWPAPVHYGAAFLGGNLWAVVCLVGLWQYSPDERIQRATFAYLDTMSTFVRELGDAAQGRPRKTVSGRVALRARFEAMKRIAGSAPGSGQPAAMWCGTGERVIALLAGLDSLVAGDGYTWRSAGQLLAPALHGLAQSIEAHANAALTGAPLNATEQSLPNRLLADVRCVLIRTHGAALPAEERGWLHACGTIVLALINLADERPTCDDWGRAPLQRVPLTPLGSLRAVRQAIDQFANEIRSGGRVARYALRLSLAAMAAAAMTRFTGLHQGYWLVLTAMFVVQPTVSQTIKVSSMRVWGTVLGAIVASMVALVFHNPLLLALMIVPLATGTFAARALSYVSYILFLTPHFILVAHLGAPAGSPELLAALRIGNSVAGALVAVVVSLLAWPEWERRKLESVAARSIVAVSGYLAAMREFVSSGAIEPLALAQARRNACAAIDELQVLGTAMRLEVMSSRYGMACARDLVVHLRRLIGIASPIECLAAGMNERDRQRFAVLGATCIALLRGQAPDKYAHDTCGNEASLRDGQSRQFVDIAERDAVRSAKSAGIIRARMDRNAPLCRY
ncbi:FUSC family protein [Paraburkholderia fungorum]|uniref:FUSC family protein n=1 Tax=Paraburkholderia fungorum TaxID=134537 RepID=UPI0020920640|nr:FUSC family protein [Paraburkholderia fungorum]USU21244.1 FUSC family protein [Paraburkholderia fungorum]USU26759.1 FUSC family protein [Paraburkholderia fungorum]